MIAADLAGLAVPLGRLDSLPGNPRHGDVDAVARSYAKFGQRKPVVARRVGERGVVIAGNHQLAAARKLGWAEIAVVWVDDDDETAAAFALADNRTADLGGYDDAALVAMLSSVEDAELLSATGWSDSDIKGLLAGLDPEVPPPGSPDPDAVPDAPSEPVSVFGDLWFLGPHRLLCGDSNDVTAHDQLLAGERPGMIFTDPPYGMGLQADYSKIGHGGGRAYAQIIGDDQPYDASSLIAMYGDVDEQFWWGADYYRTTIPSGGSWIVWDKRHNDSGMELDKLFGSVFELCWSRQHHKREVARVLWAMTHGTQRAGEDAKRGLHPTQKPTALVRWFFERWGSRGDIVADFYGGSGTTLIACEQTGRVARMIELDPGYVDVICRRYQEMTGTKPTRDGVRHDFTEEGRCAEPEVDVPRSPSKNAGTGTRRRKTPSSSTQTTE